MYSRDVLEFSCLPWALSPPIIGKGVREVDVHRHKAITGHLNTALVHVVHSLSSRVWNTFCVSAQSSLSSLSAFYLSGLGHFWALGFRRASE